MIKFPIITTTIINLMMVTMVTSQAVLWDGSIVPPPSNSVCRLYGLPSPPCLLFTIWASWLWLLALLVWLQFKIAMYHTHTLNLIHKRKSSALLKILNHPLKPYRNSRVFGDKFVTEFGESLNLVRCSVKISVTILVFHQNRWWFQWQFWLLHQI